MSEIVETAWCEAKSNGDFIVVDTYSGYAGSVQDPQGMQHLLPPHVDDEELGTAVLDCLAHSRFLPPDRHRQELLSLFDCNLLSERYSEWVNRLMARYGYKTKRSLFRNMRHCCIERQAGAITIRPSRHEKLEGWSGDGIGEEDYVVLAARSDPAAIGAGLKQAFERCK
ncbi:MAG: CdiI family contact-dependent growth inhibition immunity protein [Planctomycetaceae bacterium]|nr:CdiI family contact-dependent growth inhibition immunity protein [Planctomycetaceae bacterium]